MSLTGNPAFTVLIRLLCVEHVEENEKPCLYLVSGHNKLQCIAKAIRKAV
jgi:hypothetical protein